METINDNEGSEIGDDEILSPPFTEPSLEIYRDSHYVRTTNGITSYQLFEPEIYVDDNNKSSLRPRLIKNLRERKYHKKPLKVVYFFHGLVIWSVTFHRFIQSLIDQEFTVLLFDFFGRGKSDSPITVPYGLDLLLSQGIDLLDYLKIETVYMVGYSMGGCVATHFASTHPQRLIKLILMGPALAPVPNMPFLSRLVTYPYIGKFLFSLFGAQSLVSRFEKERFATDIAEPELIDQKVIDDLIDKVKWQVLEKPNYLNAFHSTICNIPFHSGFAHLLKNIQKSLPIYIILGTKDQTIPYENSLNFFKQYTPQAQITSIECGHSFSLEKPIETCDFIIQYLKEPL